MAISVAPYPTTPTNPATLAELTLAGISQLRQELNARTQISQNEEDNLLNSQKLASSNMLGIQNAFANQRDFQAQQKQQGFNNFLGLSRLNLDTQAQQALAQERLAHGQYWANGGARGFQGQPLSDIPFGASLDGSGATSTGGAPTMPGPGAGSLPGGPPQAPDPNMAAPSMGPDQPPVGAPPSATGQGSVSSALFPQDQPPAPTPAQGQQPQTLSDITLQGAPSVAATQQLASAAAPQLEDLQNSANQMADQHMKEYGQSYQDSLQPDNDGSPDEISSAQGIQSFQSRINDLKGGLQGALSAAQNAGQPDAQQPGGQGAPPAPAGAPGQPPMAMNAQPVSAPAPGTQGPVANPYDPSTLPYNKRISLGGYRGVEKQRINGEDYLQFYTRDPRSGLVKAMGQPKPVKELADLSRTPMQVQLPEDKIGQFDATKYWLEKIYPGMDVKDRAANAQQAMALHQKLTQLSNDPDVVAHNNSIGYRDLTPKPGQVIAGWNYSAKDQAMVPFTRPQKPEEAEAIKQRNATITKLWGTYKNWEGVMNDPSATPDRRTVAKAQAQGLFNEIQRINSGGPLTQQPVAPGAPAGTGTGASPTSTAWYYGQ